MHEAVSNLLFQARISGAVMGYYGGQEACLIAFTFSFHAELTSTQLLKRRVQGAFIQISFSDAPSDGSDGDEDFNPLIKATYPDLVGVKGESFHMGVEETVTNKFSTKLASQAAGVGVETEIGRQTTKTFEKEAYGSVTGTDLTPHIANFSVRENSLVKDGVPRVCSVVVVVGVTPGRQFAADVEVHADVGWKWRGMLGKKTVVGLEDSPVYFNPDIIRKRNPDRMINIRGASKVVEVPPEEDWENKPTSKNFKPGQENVLKKYSCIAFNNTTKSSGKC